MANVPANLKYNARARVGKAGGRPGPRGITAYAQEQLGDVVFVELPKIGANGGGRQRTSGGRGVGEGGLRPLSRPSRARSSRSTASWPARSRRRVNQDPYGKAG